MKKVTTLLFCAMLIGASAQVFSQNVKEAIGDQINQLIENNHLTSKDVNWQITNEHTSNTSGVKHIYYTQTLNGIQINGTQSSIHLLPNGEVLKSNNKFVGEVLNKVQGNTSAAITAPQAVQYAASYFGYTVSEELSVINRKSDSSQETVMSNGGISKSDIPAKLVYQLTATNALVLAWDLSIQENAQENWWSVRVDATTGEIVDQVNWMSSCDFEHDHSAHETLDYNKNLFNIEDYNAATTVNERPANGLNEAYNVFAQPLESPYYGARTIEQFPSDATASPFGWHDTNGVGGAESTFTIGNNVDAYEDGDNPGYRPDGGSNLDFTTFPFDQVYSTTTQYEDAAITNLFYWSNIIHDVMYQYGFDEASGNFQENNYGNGGAGGDSVNAEAQDGSGTCNANFGTPGDGGNPTMQMYTCGDKDGDFDNLVIVHEYGHGVSNRLTGGPSNSGCLGNQEQMGEGWSDWIGIMMTIEPGDLGTDGRAVGTYLFGQGINGAGIRPFPYNTDMGQNPMTYDDIKTNVAPHGVGSVWSTILWEMAWALIDDHGLSQDIYTFTGDVNQDAGNVQAMALVIEGMKLQPCSPGFVDGRDAILAADMAIYGGANQCTLWDAFAKRGLGVSADQGSTASKNDGTEAFDTPSSVADMVAPDDVCGGTAVMTGLGGGSPSGGVYSGPGVTDAGDGATFSFDPMAAGVGVHTITYSVPATDCSVASAADDTIEVLAIPAAPSATGVSDFCVGDDVTVSAVPNDSNNIIRWYDAQVGGNFLFEGNAYTFAPSGTTSVYAAETPPGPASQLKISEITLQSPDRFEIQNVGLAADYSGYTVALSDTPYSNINSVNPNTVTLGNMGADSAEYWDDSNGSGQYWGSNIFWNDGSSGWILIIDDNGDVVDSVFWNFTSSEIAGFNVTVNGFNITAADLDWSGDGAQFLNTCNDSYRRNDDNDSNADWSGVCETSDYGVANSDIDLGFDGCLGDRAEALVTADMSAPTISCPANITVAADAGSCTATAVALGTPVTADNCGGETSSNDAPTDFPIGVTTVTWTVIDTAGNESTCEQTVTVTDDEMPEITCSADITVPADNGTCVAATLNLEQATAVDNCGIDSITNDAPTEFPVGDTTVTWTATDNAGNSVTCTQIVTVEDAQAPTVECPEDVVEVVSEGELYTIPDYTTSATAADNCTTSPALTQSPVAGTTVGAGTVQVTITAIDDAGNEGECTFILTVDEILGLDDNALNAKLVLYPNPTTGSLTLLNKSSVVVNGLTVIDVNGRTIQHIDVKNANPQTDFSIENLATGMYFVKIETETTSLIKQVIKK